MGRPKTTVSDKLSKIKFDVKRVEELAGLGLTDEQIGRIIGVTEMTVNRWKKDNSFLLALKKGKEKADMKVVESLYQRAIGYSHEDTYFSNYQGTVTATPYTKHYAPDPTSMIFWLKNRDKTNWRDVQDITSGGEPINSVAVVIKRNEKKDT